MSAIDNQPSNPSFLSPLGFKFEIKRAPHLNFFVQSVELPSVTLGTADVETPFTRIPLPGTRLTFGNLQVTFKVDEDLKNYLEMYDWLKAIGFPDNFEQYSNIAGMQLATGSALYSDCTLTVTTSAMNPNKEIVFIDCFPVDLSSISFDSTSVDVQYLTATVTFANRRFDVRDII